MKMTGKAVEKIWALTTTHVLPSFLTPAGTRLRGIASPDARAHEIRAITQAEKDAEDIRAGRARLDSTGQLIRVPPLHSTVPVGDSSRQSQATPTVIEEARTAADLQNLQKHINERRALAMAVEEAAGIPDERVSDEPLDPDWFAMWRDCAQGVSNEEMRRLWACIMAGEVTQPSSYSLHTLDILRRLSRKDARLIEKVAPFIIDGVIPSIVVKSRMTPFKDLLELAEMGILSGVEAPELVTTRTSVLRERFEHHLICNNKVLLVLHDDPKKELSFNCVKATNVGSEILSIGHFEANISFLDKFIDHLKEKGFSVKSGDHDRVNDVVHNLKDR